MNTQNKDRFPVTDEQDDDFVDAGEHEDIVFDELEKGMEKINQYFEMQNEK